MPETDQYQREALPGKILDKACRVINFFAGKPKGGVAPGALSEVTAVLDTTGERLPMSLTIASEHGQGELPAGTGKQDSPSRKDPAAGLPVAAFCNHGGNIVFRGSPLPARPLARCPIAAADAFKYRAVSPMQ